jgi:hypothetical protein
MTLSDATAGSGRIAGIVAFVALAPAAGCPDDIANPTVSNVIRKTTFWIKAVSFLGLMV